jgi:8-oxo-dGTP diphosphatase
MRYGISAGALIMRGNGVLLVHHKVAESYDFWVPPGGRLRGEESIFDCAKREVFEETGLRVEPERIVYIEEFVEPGRHHSCKFWILCNADDGPVSLANRDPDELHFLVDAQFVTRDQMESMTVYPPIMKGQFWSDAEAGFPCTRYLGVREVTA